MFLQDSEWARITEHLSQDHHSLPSFTWLVALGEFFSCCKIGIP